MLSLTKVKSIIHNLNNQLWEQNEYVTQLETRIDVLIRENEQIKLNQKQEEKDSSSQEFDIVVKTPDSATPGDNAVTTKATSDKKKIEPIEEVEYSGDHFADVMNSPDLKRKQISKTNNLYSSLRPPKTNSLHSSLPASLRDTSYFDGRDQIRTLLGQNKHRTEEKDKENKEKQGEISYNDGDVNIETDFEFE